MNLKKRLIGLYLQFIDVPCIHIQTCLHTSGYPSKTKRVFFYLLTNTDFFIDSRYKSVLVTVSSTN
jgi:hypothetical protein